MDTESLLSYIDRNCSLLKDSFANLQPADRDALIGELLETPNPRRTAGRLDHVLNKDTAGFVKRILDDRLVRHAFLATVAGSSSLSAVVRRRPELLDPCFLQRGWLQQKTRAVMNDELAQRMADVPDTAGFDRELRLYKEEEYLRIGCRDLSEAAHITQIMTELSDLAAACIQTALDFHRERIVLKHGLPEEVSDQGGLTVIGMGKVSGGELNFSSDVDLIYLRGPEEGRTAGPTSVSVVRFYENLVRSVTRSLSDVTEDGLVFRIDLRLRPEGEKGELVPSMTNALDYYLGWGRTWERAALMKAVPIAGDRELGEEFVQELEPFIYRKHLDFSTLEDMRAIKLRIQSSLKRKSGLDIKLGQGGIREIEFFVQALQLINAGRTRRVRSPSTLKALNLLRETGLLDEETCTGLTEAYLFFRKVEHRIQIDHQRQTHELPRSREEQEELARRMGYTQDALDAFLRDLEEKRHFVEDLFAGMFRQSGEEVLQRVPLPVHRILQSMHSEESASAVLSECGFMEPAASYTILRSLLAPSHSQPSREKDRVLLDRLAPLLIQELLSAPEPDRTLVALSGYIDSLHSGSGYLSTFLENPPTVQFLVNILGESGLFTDLLIRHPEAIDSLITRSGEDHPKERETLEAELSERLAYCEDFEAKLDVLRRFKNEEVLMIGVRHLLGEIQSTYARWLVTELAEACLQAAVQIGKEEMAGKFGGEESLDPLPFVVLAMGKFGGMEMTYVSDLDVIFIYDSPRETIGRLSTHEWFSRLGNRIISILSVPTSEGSAFTIDTRLRPSGNKGPLVCSMDAFREYHRTTSQIWEKQALTKARPVIGPPDLAHEATAIVRECIMRTELTQEGIKEIDRLRSRMENELALENDQYVDLKTGQGGLVDVEFFVQANILAHGRNYPEILFTNTLEAIAEMRRAGLLDRKTFTTLDSGYRFLSNLEDRLRIMEHRSVNRMPLTGEKLKGLALRLGYGNNSGDKLVEDYFKITESIRRIYNSFFDVDGNSRPNP